MASKFKCGDEVIASSYKAKVLSVIKDSQGNFKYLVKFDNSNLIPQTMEFSEEKLLFNNNDSVCPICKTKWSIVKFNMKTWKDCKKCNKTYEDITEEIKNSPPPIPDDSRKTDKLIKEFELMLDGLDDLSLDDDCFNDYRYDFDDDEF